ncbi:MAG: hypothetical protein ACI857_002547 [Arenicella sp.]|jgi:hypothetical protein
MDFTKLKNSYPTVEHAEMDAKILNSKGIQTELIHDQIVANTGFLATSDLTRIFLAVESTKVEAAQQELQQAIEEMNNSFEEEHYLTKYSEEELIAIIKTPDEWSEFDYNFTLDLLKEKGIEFTEDEKIDYYEIRMEILAEPQRAKGHVIVFAYLMIMGFLGPLIGLFLWQGINKLPNGEKVYRYDDFTRTHGAIVGVLGVIVLLLAITGVLFPLIHSIYY